MIFFFLSLALFFLYVFPQKPEFICMYVFMYILGKNFFKKKKEKEKNNRKSATYKGLVVNKWRDRTGLCF